MLDMFDFVMWWIATIAAEPRILLVRIELMRRVCDPAVDLRYERLVGHQRHPPHNRLTGGVLRFLPDANTEGVVGHDNGMIAGLAGAG